MIFDNIDFHNVAEMEKTPKGYEFHRLPENIRKEINPGARDNIFGTGIELRFKMPDGACDIYLSSDYLGEAPVACIYYGTIQGGYEYSTKIIYEEPTRIHIEYPSDMDRICEISRRNNFAFNPEVVRLILPYTNCRYVRVDGNVILPEAGDVPEVSYLAYGSSITHGSLGLVMPYSYPFRIAQKMNCDYINLGFAGCAHMEESIARHIVSRKDWTFASVEMGINALGAEDISEEEFEHRIDVFTDILSKDERDVFATCIFKFNEADQAKADRYRAIVEKYASERLIFTPGLTLMGEERYVSADLIHPTLEGMEMIADNWSRVMVGKILK